MTLIRKKKESSVREKNDGPCQDRGHINRDNKAMLTDGSHGPTSKGRRQSWQKMGDWYIYINECCAIRHAINAHVSFGKMSWRRLGRGSPRPGQTFDVPPPQRRYLVSFSIPPYLSSPRRQDAKKSTRGHPAPHRHTSKRNRSRIQVGDKVIPAP